MIPLVIDVEELKILKELILKIKLEIEQRENIKIPCQIGTMIELPRACLMADKISEYADFFSFGTNDLTQSTLGLSRDDSVKFMKEYINQKIFTNDPFETLDDGVKELIKIAMIRSKKKRKI